MLKKTQQLKHTRRMRRKKHVRKHVFGTPERPRLSVHRTEKHIYGQIVDDTRAHTLVACSSLAPELREELPHGGNVQAAQVVGAKLAERAAEQGIKKVCFDRSAFKYRGRVRAFADAARKAGLEF